MGSRAASTRRPPKIPRAIGLSGSTVSRAFIQASATKLRAPGAGPLRGSRGPRAGRQDVAEATMVVALGQFRRNTRWRTVIGYIKGKSRDSHCPGVRGSAAQAFRHRALRRAALLGPRLAAASPARLQPSGVDEALAEQSLQHELEDRNQSAAGSLAEGLDETLTLHRLGVYGVLGRSLKTTNGLESINALIESAVRRLIATCKVAQVAAERPRSKAALSGSTRRRRRRKPRKPAESLQLGMGLTLPTFHY